MSEVSTNRRARRSEPSDITTPSAAATAAPVSEIETEIDLLELFFRLLESWKIIFAIAMAGAIIAGVVSYFFITPQYEATSKLYILNSKDSAVNLSDLQIGSYLTKDYQEVFKTWEVHERVLQNLGLDYSYRQMQSMLSISNPSDTRVLYITAKTSDPQLSTNIANEYATVARQYISDMMATEEPNIISIALRPTAPVSPNKKLNVMLGFVLGAVLMAGIITIRFILDDKIKTSDDIAKYLDLPTLAIVPVEHGQGTEDGARKSESHSRSKSKGKKR